MPVVKNQMFIESAGIEWEAVTEGVRRKITSYGDALMTVVVEFKKGSVGYLHQHPHVQITYIQAGSFEVSIDGQKKILGTGDFYYVNPGLEHGVVALEDGLLLDVFTPMREDFIQAN
jgi:quercetin dioxygenase-like cupin family protein